MNKRQSKLIWLLEKEGLMDKGFKLWCRVLKPNGDIWINVGSSVNTDNDYYLDSNESELKYVIRHEDDMEIIGQYHLGTLVNYCVKKRDDFRFRLWGGWKLSKFVTITKSVEIDLVTPPMERIESQNKELVEFLESL